MQLPPKKEVALVLLEGPSMYVHLDPRREGVVVPKWLANRPQLILQLGINMVVAIPDLDIGDEGIGCTLSFNRKPFWCFLPWSAIYSLVCEDGRAMIWPDDVPTELPAEQQRASLKAVPAKKQKSKKRSPVELVKDPKSIERPPPKLAVVAPEEPETEEPAPSEPPLDSDSRRDLPPYLRVIK